MTVTSPCTSGGILASVAVVVQHNHLLGLPHAVQLISQFADESSRTTIEDACARGHPCLARRILAINDASGYSSCYVAHLCNQAIDRAAGDGRLSVIVDFCRYFPDLVITHAPRIAAANAHTHVLSWLFGRAPLVIWGPDCVKAAIECSLTSLRWFSARLDITKDPHNLLHAVDAGPDAVVEYVWILFVQSEKHLSSLGAAISRATLAQAMWMADHLLSRITISLDTAASRGDLKYLKWAAFTCEKNRLITVIASTRAMDLAAANGHLEVVAWLHTTRTEGCTTYAIDQAAAHGHLHVVQWLYQHRQESCTDYALLVAAANGHLNVLDWLIHTYPAVTIPNQTFDRACAMGQLHVAQYLTDRDVSGTSQAMDWAAAGGHLPVVQWLHIHRPEGCTTAAMDYAATNGHLNVLQWLDAHRSEGCTTAAMDGAAGRGHFHVVLWLQQRNAGCTFVAIQDAASRGDMAMVLWLNENYQRASSVPAIDCAIASGDQALVAWFLETRRETCTTDAADIAANCGYMSIMEYLRRNASVRFSPLAFESALQMGNLYVAGWLAANYPDVADLRLLRLPNRSDGWSDSILSAVFHKLRC